MSLFIFLRCGEDEGVPVMLNCLACGAVESQRD